MKHFHGEHWKEYVRGSVHDFSSSVTSCSPKSFLRSTVASWPLIDELRLVANVVKHGEGASAEDLRKIRADMIVYPTLRNDKTGMGTLRIEASLFCHDFFVTKEEFERYHKGSVAFWTELADALPKLTR